MIPFFGPWWMGLILLPVIMLMAYWGWRRIAAMRRGMRNGEIDPHEDWDPFR